MPKLHSAGLFAGVIADFHTPTSATFAASHARSRRILPALFLIVSIVLALAAPSSAQSPSQVQQLAEDGQKAMAREDFAAAARDFEQAYRLNPQDPILARSLLLSYLQS